MTGLEPENAVAQAAGLFFKALPSPRLTDFLVAGITLQPGGRVACGSGGQVV